VVDAGYGVIGLKGIHRTTAFGGFQTNGKGSGTHWGAGLKAAWSLDRDGITLRPWAGLRTERVSLAARSESACSVAVDGLRCAAGTQLRGFGWR
jgi:hypothetical protein